MSPTISRARTVWVLACFTACSMCPRFARGKKSLKGGDVTAYCGERLDRLVENDLLKLGSGATAHRTRTGMISAES